MGDEGVDGRRDEGGGRGLVELRRVGVEGVEGGVKDMFTIVDIAVDVNGDLVDLFNSWTSTSRGKEETLLN